MTGARGEMGGEGGCWQSNISIHLTDGLIVFAVFRDVSVYRWFCRCLLILQRALSRAPILAPKTDCKRLRLLFHYMCHNSSHVRAKYYPRPCPYCLILLYPGKLKIHPTQMMFVSSQWYLICSQWSMPIYLLWYYFNRGSYEIKGGWVYKVLLVWMNWLISLTSIGVLATPCSCNRVNSWMWLQRSTAFEVTLNSQGRMHAIHGGFLADLGL